MGCNQTKCKKCGVVKKGCNFVNGLCPNCVAAQNSVKK